MNTTSLLDDIIAMLNNNVDGVRFIRAYSAAGCGRRPTAPIVTGEVESEELKNGRTVAKLKFLIFLPENAEAKAAEKIFAKMCFCVGEEYYGFSAVTRGGVQRDNTTGLLRVECVMTFIERDGSFSAEGRSINLGGKDYPAKSITTKMTYSGKELVSVGETAAFATLDGDPEYTVELNGMETSGLEKLATFTAVTDDGTAYYGCRWKNICNTAGTAAFVSSERVGCEQ